MKDWLDLHALSDGELPAAEAKALQARLAQDPALRREYEAIGKLKSGVRKHIRAHENEEAWRVCCGRLDDLDKARRVEGFVGKHAWSLCAVVFVSLLAGGLYQRFGTGPAVGQDDVARMSASFAPNRRADSPESGRWVGKLLSQADQATRRVYLQSVDEGVAEGRRALRYRLSDAQGPMTLIVMPGVQRVEGLAGREGDRYQTLRQEGANTLVWTGDGAAFFLTAPRDSGELARVADRISPR